jgi:superfamily II DNA or RNA helicase
VRLEIRLSADERERYPRRAEDLRRLHRAARIPIRSPQGWQTFIRKAARSKAGREAFLAYQESRRIIHGAERKLDLLGTLLDEEWGRRTIVFTNDNRTAYDVSRQFLVPCITHHTDVKERRAWLQAFESGELPVLVTSRVLNEGVDLPAAEVAIVLSGTGTVREHVQRLGRILRPGEGKRAILYEIVAADTTEKHTSDGGGNTPRTKG